MQHNLTISKIDNQQQSAMITECELSPQQSPDFPSYQDIVDELRSPKSRLVKTEVMSMGDLECDEEYFEMN